MACSSGGASPRRQSPSGRERCRGRRGLGIDSNGTCYHRRAGLLRAEPPRFATFAAHTPRCERKAAMMGGWFELISNFVLYCIQLFYLPCAPPHVWPAWTFCSAHPPSSPVRLVRWRSPGAPSAAASPAQRPARPTLRPRHDRRPPSSTARRGHCALRRAVLRSNRVQPDGCGWVRRHRATRCVL